MRRRAGAVRDRKWLQQRHLTTTGDFRLDYRPGPGDVLRVIPCIDTIPLTDLIDTFEISAGMRPAGGWYAGLALRSGRFERPMAYFHGSAPPTTEHKTPVLVCTCGELGCGGLLTRITLTGNLVVWDRFGLPYRTDRDYSAFGPFLFDRDRYDKAVRALDAELATDK
ncbi:hypothetical protein [Nocardia sp. NBC_01327]|uniref:hypothetical protein n=1 Tax=Nocardia sp. NBC_01327 TaxID=2903593 RepID=UPI002E0E5140|nr:hypothetical protein OG326_35775 [Nocardia sp. NBC_01327]